MYQENMFFLNMHLFDLLCFIDRKRAIVAFHHSFPGSAIWDMAP